jgi:hypothetical protein
VKIHKTSHVNSRIDKKMGELMCFQQCLQSITCFPFLQKLNSKGKKDSGKEQKKNKEMRNLEHDITLWFSKPQVLL